MTARTPAEMLTDDGQRVVDQQRRGRNQAGVVADVLLRDDVGAAAGRVRVNRLPVGKGDDRRAAPR